MLLLVTTGQPDMHRYASPHLGRLVQPRHYSSIEQTAWEGIPWAADNDCFQGLRQEQYLEMVSAIRSLPGCRFLTCPDVVGDAGATSLFWTAWRPVLGDIPVGFVCQDGIENYDVPWDEMSALFIGGTTEFKLGPIAADLARSARARGKWVHMGRVNSKKRIKYAHEIGCHSVDGTMWAKWKKRYLRWGLDYMATLSRENT